MNYLDRIRQIDGQKIFAHVPEIEPTKPPKAPSVSFVGTPHGVFANAQVEKMHVDPVENDEGVASFTWLMHFIDRDPLIANFALVVTHAEALACYPDAVAAEPIEPLPELAEPAVTTKDHPDDRRTCGQCANLIARRCEAVKRGEIAASRSYEPIRDLSRRCEGYVPRTADLDKRLGGERWTELTDLKGMQ